MPPDLFVKKDEKVCYAGESNTIKVIRERHNEIGFGSPEVLTCNTYEAIQSYSPNMVFVHYKKAGTLTKLIAEKCCPSYAGREFSSNVGGEKERQIYVQTQNDGDVRLKDWIMAKKSALDWALGLNSGATCVRDTRSMEDSLSSCEDGIVSL